MEDEKTETLIRRLKSALDNYGSYKDGRRLNSILLYIKEAEKILNLHNDSENSQGKLRRLVSACKTTIIENNRGLIIKKAKFYTNITQERSYYEDFFQEGTIGLLKALPNYNPARGKFHNYAAVAIGQSIERKLQEILDSIGGVPINFPIYSKEIKRISEAFKRKYNRAPTNEELAKLYKKTVKRIKDLKRIGMLCKTLSLNAELHRGDEDAGCLLDYYIDNSKDFPEEEYIKSVTRWERMNCINRLSDKRQKRIMLGRLEGKSLEEIALLEENVKRQRIKQIQDKAVEKLKEMESFKKLKED